MIGFRRGATDDRHGDRKREDEPVQVASIHKVSAV
jgi:hypothetical protein